MSSSFHIKAISESKLRPLNAKSASSVVGLKLLIEVLMEKTFHQSNEDVHPSLVP